LRERVVATNREWAAKLNIKPAAATTCNKPSGTVSLLAGCSSGIHPRYSRHYIRTVRADKKDPLAKLMVEMGFPHEDDVVKPEYNWVFSFPMKSPENSVLRDDITAIKHLELWKIYQDHWTEHKPSVTIQVRESEWMEVGAWVYRHFDSISGVAFLPYSGHNYRQAPYQEITEVEYKRLLDEFPKNIDWSKLGQFEQEDNTQIEKQFACNGDSCELTDMGTK
jgi:ribonucleoside-diphosphate reductase alpha chain